MKDEGWLARAEPSARMKAQMREVRSRTSGAASSSVQLSEGHTWGEGELSRNRGWVIKILVGLALARVGQWLERLPPH